PPPPASPAPAMRRLSEFAAQAAEPQAPPARLRRLAELTAAEHLDPPGEGAPPRRFALLNDIAVELRPRRSRARSPRRP
ncbi:MAG: hypothetical protein K5Q68_22175, partial [Roseococcus sp.]|nr:hypothetical protein [Roseococcus sp.]